MSYINTSFTSIIPSTSVPSSTSRRSCFVFLFKSRFQISCSLGGTIAEPKATTSAEPLLPNAVRGVDVERPPVWLMRQAGRYMKDKGPVIIDPVCKADEVDQVREFVPEDSVPLFW